MKTADRNKEDWHPITPSTSKEQIHWCQNKPRDNVRARKVGEKKWKVLAEGTRVPACTADLVGMAMLRGERKCVVVPDFF